jgi:membrane-bound metal-dependent hydrolase YbcI (DUF457 family)
MGHAIGGLAAAFIADSALRRWQLTPALLIISAGAAMAPDLDLLTGSHRTYTHSVGAVLIVGLVSYLAMRRRVPSAFRAACVLMAAYGSHLVLDWSGADSSRPPGLMIAWPISPHFYVSGWNLFGEVSRRYWRPHEFIIGNLMALAWEMIVIGLALLVAWAVWSKGTLQTTR